MSVTAHGVLMALVFTTFFIMALGYAVAQRENGDVRWPKLAWAMFALAVVGVISTAWAILSFKASVLYTFYPPLQAHPAFYIGLTLVVIASWGWCMSLIASWRESRQRNGDRPTSLAMHATAANAMLWLLATLGVATEMLFQLIPWSLGWVRTVDPLLARTLFWFFGHPLVYFWVLPAYTIWYALIPREAGGKLFSEPLARVTFALFLILSTPVGFHHQYQDPGISASWKLFHTFNTMAISFPSLMTAFTVIASLEVAGRMRGGTGLFGWIKKLPWGNPVVSSVLLAGLLFMVALYAEGQRRYVESLSAYARQFLGQMDKPDVDSIEGLSPAISIDQKTTTRNPRSTVGTVTEIYDYLRLLYARVGRPHCPTCGREISGQSAEQIVEQVLSLPEGTRFTGRRAASCARARASTGTCSSSSGPTASRASRSTARTACSRSRSTSTSRCATRSRWWSTGWS